MPGATGPARTLRGEVATHPDDEQLRVLLTTAFARWIESRRNVPSPAMIAEAFAPWTDEDAVRDRRLLVLDAAVVRYNGLPKGAGVSSLVESLRAIVSADPDHLLAHCQLSIALNGLAWERRERMVHTVGADRRELRAAMAAALTECEKRTAVLLPRLGGDEYTEQRTRLATILGETRKALGAE